VLTHFNPAKPIHLETDASGFTIAGIISHQQNDAHDDTNGSVHIQALCNKSHRHLVVFRS
jgi:hypothetical protein